MKAFYKKLLENFTSEEVKNQFTDKALDPIRFVDLYAGQDQDPEYFEVFPLPALLVDWQIDYQSNPPVAAISFHILHEQLRDTSNLGINTDEALKALTLVEMVDQVLQSIESETTGKLKLIYEGQKREETITDVYLLDYQCSYTGKIPLPGKGYVKGQINEVETVESLEQRSGLYSKLLD